MHPDETDAMFGLVREIRADVKTMRTTVDTADLPKLCQRVEDLWDERNQRAGAEAVGDASAAAWRSWAPTVAAWVAAVATVAYSVRFG